MGVTTTANYADVDSYADRYEVEPPDGDTHLTHCSDLFDEFLIKIGRVQREYARAAVEQTVRHGWDA